MRCASAAPNNFRSPMKRSRTPFRCRSATSRSSASRKRFMSIPTSSGGLRQFSLLKANSVKYPTLRRAHSSTILRTTLMLARWPAGRGRTRRRAHRPLPSMMMATCCGDSSLVFTGKTGSAWRNTGDRLLDLHQFLFLVRHRLIDVRHMLVGELLNVILRATVLVLRDELFLEHLLQVVHHFAAHVAHRDPRSFRFRAHNLRDVAPPFFGERRHGDANQRPGGIRSQTQIGLVNRLLHDRD